MRHRTRARREGGIPPTKYRAADGGCSAREESRFSPKRETNACAVCPVPEDALRGLLRRRQRGGTHENETSRAGLRPEGIYVYVERSQGRANRPFLVGEHRCGEASRTMLCKSALAIHSASNACAQGGGRRKYGIISAIPLVPWCSGCTRVFDTQSSGSTPDGTTSVSLTNR